MAKFTESVNVEIDVTPHRLGVIFAGMSAEEQAEFFEGIASDVASWTGPQSFQWGAMLRHLSKHPQGLCVFRSMAEYAGAGT